MDRKVSEFLQFSTSPKRGSPVSNQILRNTMRRLMHKDYQNEIYVSLLEMKLAYLTGDNRYQWYDDFIDFKSNLEHPYFNKLIKIKLEHLPLKERSKHVRQVLETLTYEEVGEFCYQMDAEALAYFRSHIEEHVRKQEVIKFSDAHLLDSYNALKSLDGKIIVDETSDLNEYIENGGQIENFKVVQDSETEDAQEIKYERIIEKDQLDADGLYFDSRIDGLYVASVQQIKTNAVYELSLNKYTGINFPVMLYAPPCSGKTELNKERRCYTDTDAMLSWQLQKSGGLYITNMPHLIKHSRYSIAVIPTKKEFYERCRSRGLDPDEQWYLDLVNESNKANCKVLSNKYLLELSCIGGSVSK